MRVAVNGCDDTGIAWPVPFYTNEGFDGCLSDDFVVVLPNPGLFACDVWPLQHRLEKGGVVDILRRYEWRQFRWSPFGFQLKLRHAVVKEFNGQVGHGRLVVTHVEHAG